MRLRFASLAVAAVALGLSFPSAAGAVSAIAYERDFPFTEEQEDQGEQDPSGIWAKQAGGGEATRLIRGFENLPDFAPDGGRLMFVGTGVEVSNVDGTNRRTVYPPVYPPTFSFSGRIDFGPGNQIAIATSTDNQGPADEIRAISADGTGSRVVYAPPEKNLSSPSFSPDGSQIVFNQSDSVFFTEGDGLWVVNADGNGATPLTFNRDDNSPAFSPDGTRIAFARSGDIFVMNADGSGATNITNTAGVFENQPAFSPDGTRLAMSTFVPDSTGFDNAHIETIGVDGSNRTDLTGADPGYERDPTWANVAALPPPPSDAAGGSADGGSADDAACDRAKAKLKQAKKKLRKRRRNDASKQAIKRAKKKVREAREAKQDAC